MRAPDAATTPSVPLALLPGLRGGILREALSRNDTAGYLTIYNTVILVFLSSRLTVTSRCPLAWKGSGSPWWTACPATRRPGHELIPLHTGPVKSPDRDRATAPGASSPRSPDVRKQEPEPAERLAYSIDEAARLTGLSRDLLYDEMRRGNLAYVKVGRRRLITRHHLQQFLGNISSEHHWYVPAVGALSVST